MRGIWVYLACGTILCGAYNTVARSWILGSAVLVTAVALIRGCRLRREGLGPVQVRLSARGAGQRDGVGAVSLRPWHKEQDTEVFFNRRGRCRIRIWELDPRYTFVTAMLVDFAFEGDVETAERLRELIRRWREEWV